MARCEGRENLGDDKTSPFSILSVPVHPPCSISFTLFHLFTVVVLLHVHLFRSTVLFTSRSRSLVCLLLSDSTLLLLVLLVLSGSSAGPSELLQILRRLVKYSLAPKIPMTAIQNPMRMLCPSLSVDFKFRPKTFKNKSAEAKRQDQIWNRTSPLFHPHRTLNSPDDVGRSGDGHRTHLGGMCAPL